MFGWDFEENAWSRFWRWSLIKICVWTCDMTQFFTLERWTQPSGVHCAFGNVFNGNWGICYCFIKLSLSLNSGYMSSNEACLFPGKCLLLNFLGRCKRTAGKRWKPHLSICFLWNVCPCKTATAKVPKCKITRTKCRCQDHHCPPGDPHCFHLHLPRSWILLLVQLYPAKHRRFYQGIYLHWLRLNFNQSIKLEKDI